MFLKIIGVIAIVVMVVGGLGFGAVVFLANAMKD